jgi:hypothetical protein
LHSARVTSNNNEGFQAVQKNISSVPDDTGKI